MSKDNDRILNDIRREYDRLQSQSRTELETRKQEIFEKIPAYRSLLQNARRAELCALYEKLGEQRGTDPAEKTYDNESLKKEKERLLAMAGYPKDYLSPRYQCMLCRDTGYLEDANGARTIRCKCFTSKLSRRLSEESGLGELLLTENFEHLSMDYYQGEDLENFKRNKRLVEDFLQNSEDGYKNFFFYGNIGTGKSFLSCCVAKEFLDRGRDVVYVSSSDLFDRLAAEKKPDRSDQPKDGCYRNLIYDCELLILDDLGTEWFNGFVFSELFSLINGRIRKKRSTIISTNLTLPDLTRIYSERIFSRISSEYLLCKFSGEDIRKIKAREKQKAIKQEA